MRSLLLLPLLAVAAPAAAQSLTTVTTLPVTGSVPQVCAMQQGAIQSGSLVNVAGLDGDTLRIIQFEVGVQWQYVHGRTSAARIFAHAIDRVVIVRRKHQTTIAPERIMPLRECSS